MTPSSPSPPAGPLTVLVTRRVRPGHEAAFERAMQEMIAAARAFPGHLGAQLIAAADADTAEAADADPADDSGLHHVVFAFDTAAHLSAWQASAERARCLQAIGPHTVGAARVKQVGGLALWFQEPAGLPRSPPPRWKVAVVTWLGICPTVFLLFLTVAPWLDGWPLLPRVMVITVLVVLVMTWGVAPVLTRWFAPWLHPASKA